jgi:hypothetical protein
MLEGERARGKWEDNCLVNKQDVCSCHKTIVHSVSRSGRTEPIRYIQLSFTNFRCMIQNWCNSMHICTADLMSTGYNFWKAQV